ncbi:zinc finger protein 621-like isoform X1 [Dermochelys coriacea]|uniref:zinc finger protein 621-like isoform X1 n=1 Tax=Dermochelys coriacea TaxID=27794 RepID=UPI001CA97B03|nr:zinc finger protein 621-like isoform X1 [Dermochelys coriacea]
MAVMDPAQMSVTFEEVAMYFTEGQGALLDPGQRALYRDIMQENYETVTSLVVLPIPKPDLTSQLEAEEELWILVLHPKVPSLRESPGKADQHCILLTLLLALQSILGRVKGV